MYTATVTVGANALSLRTLVNAAIAGEISDAFNGRCFQVMLIPTVTTVVLSSRGGTTVPAPPPAGNGVVLGTANIVYSFEAPTGNQLSIDDMYLSGAGTCGVVILTL